MNGTPRLVRWSLPMILFASAAWGQNITPSAYWKNQIIFPDDVFRVAGTSSADPGWVKFAILLPPYDPSVVYFQDCRQYKFHYDFAVNELDPFLGMAREQFDEATLYTANQQAVLGAVILPPTSGWPPPPERAEYGIQFVGSDAYSRDRVAEMFNTVKASVLAGPEVKAFYFPSWEQMAAAEANTAWFESQGITVSSPARWAQNNVCYSEGWALGELKFVPADAINNAYLSGQLTAADILLTDGIPAEIPMVAGVLTSAPSSGSSHVAILAQTYGVPFAYLALDRDAQRAQQLTGRRVVLRAYNTWEGTEIRLIDAEALDEPTVAEILQLKKPPPLNIRPIEHYGAYSANVDSLVPADIRYFGGKAANYGLLRTSIPGNTRKAAAFSFDLWNAFLDQTIIGGNTLRQEIESRLSQFSYPPANMAQLFATLSGIRDLFRNDNLTAFSAEIGDAVISTLRDPQYGFDPLSKIRFRSSTNVEDSEQFTGAGLYDSYSGCLADDLDGNNTGPCLCDATRDNERGVFRAIRRVFASFYNDNAYLERLRYGVNENDVGMAVLVHHSFPDEIEQANGVATLVKSSPTSSWRDITLATQLGATSVSNPTDGSVPEAVDVNIYSTTYYATLLQPSNLTVLGDMVMDWQDDYIDLSKLLVQAGDRFETVTGKTTYVLDFEYKKVAPSGRLVVKQIRQIPQPSTQKTITPFLINEPADYKVFHGEYSNVFANHRLKSTWRIQTRNMWLTQKNLSESPYSDLSYDYLRGCNAKSKTGHFKSWTDYAYSFANNAAQDSWVTDDLRNRRSYELQTPVWAPGSEILVSAAQSPILTLGDLWGGRLYLTAQYDQPVISRDWTGQIMTTAETVTLQPSFQPAEGDTLQIRDFTDKDTGISIRTSFYWPPHPTGPVAGYTAPLARWDETVITGLATEPIVLRGEYSQTYRPEHHNFAENFIFEPRLEPGISPNILRQLRLKDVRMIVCTVEPYQPQSGVVVWRVRTLDVIGFDKEMYAADLDGNGAVTGDDLGLLSDYWRKTACGVCGGADLTGNGAVGLDDLQAFAFDWLKDYYTP